jgi:hypothetical protein
MKKRAKKKQKKHNTTQQNRTKQNTLNLDVCLMLAQLVESGVETRDFLSLVFANCGSVCDLERNSVNKGFVVVVFRHHAVFLKFRNVLQNLYKNTFFFKNNNKFFSR